MNRGEERDVESGRVKMKNNDESIEIITTEKKLRYELTKQTKF